MKNAGTGIFVVFFLAAGWPGLAGAQESNPLPQRASQRVVTATRLVTVFSELETEWLQGVQQKDSAALARLLGEDFLELSPNAAGPVPREDWQQRALAQDLQSFRLRQMAVRSLNEETAVASFVLSESVQSGGALQERSSFVVDVWTRTSGRWVCTGRYVSLVSGTGPSAVEDAKPTGKH
jgi:ketosteroid isomerase-like protein